MAYDFSNPETQKLFAAEVKKRMDLFGMSREQAEMLVAVLMTEPDPLLMTAPGSARPRS
jgi:hypothetical protein